MKKTKAYNNKIVSDYPKKIIFGKFSRLRFVIGLLLISIFFGGCWLSYGNQQAILIDVSSRTFRIFNLVFWPQDLFILSLALITSFFSLFAVTTIAGRIWCGYACPQSTFFWIFNWVKRKIVSKQFLVKAPLANQINYKKILQLIIVHLTWLVIALLFAITFVGYFIPIKILIVDIINAKLTFAPAIWLLIFTLATYINAGILKEKICLNACPYARFQSVMFDDNTKIVSYNQKRGEPRARHIKSNSVNAAGDCVDCNLCVQVCPTGIDIRDGMQYECISCSACIDACNSVMHKLKRPPELISYQSQNKITKPWWQRPRFICYLLILSVTISLALNGILNRNTFSVEILPDRTVIYRVLPSGNIENIYQLKLTNKTNLEQKVQVRVQNIADAKVKNNNSFILDANSMIQEVIRVELKQTPAVTVTPLIFEIKSDAPKTKAQQVKTRFFTPKNSIQGI